MFARSMKPISSTLISILVADEELHTLESLIRQHGAQVRGVE